MTRDPIVIKPSATLLDCAREMVKKKVGSLPIVQDKKLVGFISQRDILWALVKKSTSDLSNINALEISPKKIVSARSSMSIGKVLEKMKSTKFDRLPVIHNGDFVGIITVKDILNFNPELYPELEEFAQIREETEKLKRFKIAQDRPVIYEGICEECGHRGSLRRFNGLLVCNSCKD